MKSSHANWQSLPGSFDNLNTRQLFPSDNIFGIPTLPHVGLSALPDWLAPYRTRIRSDRGVAGGAVHFFLDDYRFETAWSRPRKALQALQPYITLLSPDFSLFADYPHALQLFNTYRNRWCGAIRHPGATRSTNCCASTPNSSLSLPAAWRKHVAHTAPILLGLPTSRASGSRDHSSLRLLRR